MEILIPEKKESECDCVVIKRGDIFYADLRPVVGSEQGGVRPVLIIQNDVGNRHSPTVICAAITSKMNKAKLPTHIEIDASAYGIEKECVTILEELKKKGLDVDDNIRKTDSGTHRKNKKRGPKNENESSEEKKVCAQSDWFPSISQLV